MRAPGRRGARAEQTRRRILEVAEQLFAEHGFAAARLEDVAARLGIQRPALFYYYRDKRALYRAVLEGVFGDLLARLRSALAGPGALPGRIDAAVSAWVRYVAERPATARLLLREAAESSGRDRAFLARLTRPLVELAERIFAEGRRRGLLRPIPSELFHVGSSVVGSTVFFVAAMPALLPDLPFDPLSPERMEAHRQDVLRIARRLLGLPGPRYAGPGLDHPRRRGR